MAIAKTGSEQAAQSNSKPVRQWRAGFAFLCLFLASCAVKSPDDYLEDLKSENWKVRYDAVIELGVEKVQEARAALEERLLEDENDLVREASARSLYWLENPESVKAVTKALGDKNWRVREKSAATLGKIGGKEEIPHLEKLLNDPEPLVVEKAKDSINKIKGRNKI